MEQKHIAERLRAVIDHFEISAARLARVAGVGESNLNKMLKGQQKITPRTLHLVSSAFGVSYEWLSEGLGEMIEAQKVLQYNADGDNLNDSIKITETAGAADLIKIIEKRDQQIDRLIAIIERLGGNVK